MGTGNGTATPTSYDAVIVGASLAGCTAAILLGRAGARVALVEQRADPEAYKRICTHFIQPSAVATLERLGLLEPIEELGGVRSRLRVSTPWGWIQMGNPDLPAAVNLRRQRLDPLLRRTAAEVPGVELMLGRPVDGLAFDGDRVAGVELRDRSGNRSELRGRLVIGADGRDSRMAELAGAKRRSWPHGRIAYGGYFEDAPPPGAPNATMWVLDPDWAAAFPTDAGLTFYACMPTKDRLPAFKHDPEHALRTMLASVPDPPPLEGGRLVGTMQGKVDMTNVLRGPLAAGLALIGDAALATDPLWGVGCGWALQSGEWLADAVAGALRGQEPLERGLRRYRRRFFARLAGHAWLIHDYATGRKLQLPERLLWSAAAQDRRVAGVMEAYGGRMIGPARMMASGLPRAALIHAAGWVRGPRGSSAAVSAGPVA